MILPITAEINREGHLVIGGNDVVKLKEEYETPLYIIDIATIKNQCRNYKKNFTFADLEVHMSYAAKAFICTAMCQLMEKEGLGIDVSTGGELFIALNSGFPAEEIYFHGNNKSYEEIRYGLENKVGHFMVDNFTELKALGELCEKSNLKQNIMLRINPGIKADTHEYIQTGKINSKFGFGLHNNAAFEAVKKISEYKNLELTGITAHIGSQIFNLSCYRELIEAMMKFIKMIKDKLDIRIKRINIGGGLGIQYVSEERPPGIEDLSNLIYDSVKKCQKKYGVKIEKLYLEPGRSIIGSAGVTLYEVGGIKEINESKKYILIDGGMSDNIRPMLYQARYSAYVANKMGDGTDTPDGNKMNYSIVGKHCESGDVIINDIKLPQVSSGDFIVVATTGGYCYSLSSNYNSQPKSAVAAVENGDSWVWIKRQTYKDLVIKDVGLYKR
ncbi:MAG: diaminopimelate decarboxylase [Actinomycetota bacterium]|nr:diaminopimelate decarboxylase [Actinomycetota bacterium]